MRGLIMLVALAVACAPAPVLNPNKKSGKAGRPEVERDVTLAVAPESVVQKRDGTTIDLATLWNNKEKQQKVVIVFYRGGWCPYCQKQMAELQLHYRDFMDAKAIVVGVSNEEGPAATALRDKLGLGFELYSDPQLAMITKWGVEDLTTNIARPATFVVQPGGAITYRKVGENPSDHPSMDELLAALK